MRPVVLVALALCLAIATPLHAAPDEPTRARALKLAAEGYRAYLDGSHQVAIDKLTQADKLIHAPTHLYYLARAYIGLGNLVRGREIFLRIINEDASPNEPEAFANARRKARRDVRSLDKRIPRIQLTITGAKVLEIQIGDHIYEGTAALANPVLVNPGKHRVVVLGAGSTRAERRVTLGEGQLVSLELALGSPAAKTSTITRPVAYAALGVGAAAVVAAGITGSLSLSKEGDLSRRCPDKRCFASDKELGDEALALGHASTALFIVGAAALVGGATLLWFGGAKNETALQLQIFGPYVRVRGTF